jgi:hypothetical protein
MKPEKFLGAKKDEMVAGVASLSYQPRVSFVPHYTKRLIINNILDSRVLCLVNLIENLIN